MFYIDLLWVDESYRHQRLGSKLLRVAEQHAAKNKALCIVVTSCSFQAPEFYLKNKYRQFAKFPVVEAGKKKHYDHCFIKHLK